MSKDINSFTSKQHASPPLPEALEERRISSSSKCLPALLFDKLRVSETRDIYIKRPLLLSSVEVWAVFFRYFKQKLIKAHENQPHFLSNHLISNFTISLISFLLFATFNGCTQKKESLPVADAEILVPYQEFTNSTIHFYNKNYIQWKLQSKHMRKPIIDTGVITLVPVRMTFYDSLGIVKSLIIGDSCVIKNQMESYTIWGDVYIRTRDSMVVRSHKLNWYRDRKKVLSDTFVQIVTKKGDRLRGKGLDATEDFSRFRFASEVEGVFPNFKRRVESDEENVF